MAAKSLNQVYRTFGVPRRFSREDEHGVTRRSLETLHGAYIKIHAKVSLAARKMRKAACTKTGRSRWYNLYGFGRCGLDTGAVF